MTEEETKRAAQKIRAGDTIARDILVKAKAVLQQGWTGGDAAEARDADGKIVPAMAASATEWTPLGAIKRASTQYAMAGWSLAASWLRLTITQPPYSFLDLYAWNNAEGQTLESILTAFDDAIARLDQKYTEEPLS